ncbi:hypothetical protein P3T73_01745 [Kiritimatiellota bacterium B12222]|nr:hypothetical protein P3T73_01745 [Kiritimatiellota bacterium B12222]
MPDTLYLEKQLPWTKRHWMILAAIFFTAFILIPGIAVFLPIWDIDPVEDLALWISPEPIPEQENSWPLLVEIFQGISPNDQRDLLHWATNPENDDLDLQKWLLRNPEMLRFSELLHKPYCRPPFGEQIGAADYNSYLLQVAYCFPKIHLHSQTSSQTRFDAWLLYLRFLKVMENPQTGFYTPASQNLAFKELSKTFTQDPFVPTFSTPQLHQLTELIRSLDEDLRDDWIWSIIHDYQFQHQVFEQRGFSGYLEEYYERWGKYPPYIYKWWPFPFLYQPQRSQSLILETHQAALYHLDPQQFPYVSARNIRQIQREEFYNEGIGMPLNIFNVQGKIAALELSPAFHVWVDASIHEYQWSLHSMQLFIALLQFEQETGELPSTLAALVPKYIPELFTDPFDGQAIRYDREQRSFYAVGRDGVDQGREKEKSDDLWVILPGPHQVSSP